MLGLRVLQGAAYITFALLTTAMLIDIAQGATRIGPIWALPLIALAAWIAADFVSGFVHFLADNFGSPDTPIVGKAFILTFREHHRDPTGITRNPFLIANGGNCLVTVPPLALVWFFVDIDDTRGGYLFGAFWLFFSIAIFLTNQFHKYAHLDEVPSWVAWLQSHHLVLSKEHHDVHHVSPFDTYYCITVGWWNPFLERIRFFERTEKAIRRLPWVSSHPLTATSAGPCHEGSYGEDPNGATILPLQ